jgi:hypothetical protein
MLVFEIAAYLLSVQLVHMSVVSEVAIVDVGG